MPSSNVCSCKCPLKQIMWFIWLSKQYIIEEYVLQQKWPLRYNKIQLHFRSYDYRTLTLKSRSFVPLNSLNSSKGFRLSTPYHFSYSCNKSFMSSFFLLDMLDDTSLLMTTVKAQSRSTSRPLYLASEPLRQSTVNWLVSML